VKVEALAGAPFDLLEAPKSLLSTLTPLFRRFNLLLLSFILFEGGLLPFSAVCGPEPGNLSSCRALLTLR